MPTRIQNYFLQETESIWKSLIDVMQPNSIWITEYDFVPEDYYGQMLDRFLLNACFFDKAEILQKDVMEFKRLISVHSAFEGLRFPTKEISRTLEIGFAQFAKLQNRSNSYYFDYAFGGFNAAGFNVEFDEFGILKNKNQIWIS